ncbi:hypothetical protein R3P38DRAFT_2575026 [Favolaschia claudopus]|uniref:DUF6534 domain-containing protein n=1 Tax=Favolaschia claudopus TaxID=2862362 RepID=A0AAV9ZLU7_9AGAR
MPTLPSTYGAWFLSFFFETILYGIGVLQIMLYFLWWPNDDFYSIKLPVIVVMVLETIQIGFFCRSSYFRFVQRFGVIQIDLVWYVVHLQLLANYLTTFAVQLYFASRIYRLTRDTVSMYRASPLGLYVIVILALTQISAGLAQTVKSYQLRSFLKLDLTKTSTIVQTAASSLCDIAIAAYLCIFLHRNKEGLLRSQKILNTLMINAVCCGMPTALTSVCTMILFLVFPDTFWFFLSLAPNSKLYMNSMLATLNLRQNVRNKWKTAQIGEFPTSQPTEGHPTTKTSVELGKLSVVFALVLLTDIYY